MDNNVKNFLQDAIILSYFNDSENNVFELVIRTAKNIKFVFHASGVQMLYGEFWKELQIDNFFEYDLKKDNKNAYFFKYAIEYLGIENTIDSHTEGKIIYIIDVRGTKIVLLCERTSTSRYH